VVEPTAVPVVEPTAVPVLGQVGGQSALRTNEAQESIGTQPGTEPLGSEALVSTSSVVPGPPSIPVVLPAPVTGIAPLPAAVPAPPVFRHDVPKVDAKLPQPPLAQTGIDSRPTAMLALALVAAGSLFMALRNRRRFSN